MTITFDAVNHQRLAFLTLCASLFAFGFLLDSPFIGTALAQHGGKDITESNPAKAVELEGRLISNARQLTFEGRRAGEGYFSADASHMVFQSERHPGNPFYQIYRMDLETGDIDRVSPGHGKTTCAWIHPDGERVLFSSTHEDPQARKKQADEIAFRESGKERRYAWDYDEHFEIYESSADGMAVKNLTNIQGYDAEASWSPDGKLIAFASNRNAYSQKLSKKEAELFKIDKASMIDIFIMNADGTNVRQLTDHVGYDGGPFFSHDGKKICWRRFAENGATAEIMTMNIDGSDQKQLTRMNAMSWAPYFHPSGKYLIFTTNKHGFGNFELYLVSADGLGNPVRVSHTKGFDGLPVFTPDGKRISWTSNRTSSGNSQIYLANWNHEKALQLLGLDSATDPAVVKSKNNGSEIAGLTSPKIDQSDVRQYVGYLCRPELEGRMTGSRGEHMATAYVAGFFEKLGLKPAGDNGTWYQEFEFVSGVELEKANAMTFTTADGKKQSLKLNESWRPISFSASGDFANAPIVFAGYGIQAPIKNDFGGYDSYVHFDVKDKWVLVFRFMPEDVSDENRQIMSRKSSLRHKAMLARDLGARGLIVVNGPNAKAKSELVPLRLDGSLAGTSIPVISVTNDVASNWLAKANKSIKELQTKLDAGEMMMGIELEGLSLEGSVNIRKIKKIGRNVLGRLQFGDEPSKEAVLVGAHIDHLGRGPSSSSLGANVADNEIHRGADDNASGVAGLMEIAQYLSSGDAKLKNKRRDVIFAGWSGEELGLYGSTHFVKQLEKSISSHAHGHQSGSDQNPNKNRLANNAHKTVADKTGDEAANPHTSNSNQVSVEDQKPAKHQGPTIYPTIVACINMDMIGRMEEKLVLQGIGSSSIWRSEIERRNAPVGLAITLNDDTDLPTDASVFYQYGVPILSAFTGSHRDYHTPRDTPEKLNFLSAAKIARLMALITRSLVERQEKPDYLVRSVEKQERRANLRAWLGTIPDYIEGDVKGVKLSGVTKGAPADKSGLKAGDVITKLAGRKIENIYDYTYAIEALKIDKEVEIEVYRDGKTLKRKITPGSRQ